MSDCFLTTSSSRVAPKRETGSNLLGKTTEAYEAMADYVNLVDFLDAAAFPQIPEPIKPMKPLETTQQSNLPYDVVPVRALKSRRRWRLYNTDTFTLCVAGNGQTVTKRIPSVDFKRYARAASRAADLDEMKLKLRDSYERAFADCLLSLSDADIEKNPRLERFIEKVRPKKRATLIKRESTLARLNRCAPRNVKKAFVIKTIDNKYEALPIDQETVRASEEELQRFFNSLSSYRQAAHDYREKIRRHRESRAARKKNRQPPMRPRYTRMLLTPAEVKDRRYLRRRLLECKWQDEEVVQSLNNYVPERLFVPNPMFFLRRFAVNPKVDKHIVRHIHHWYADMVRMIRRRRGCTCAKTEECKKCNWTGEDVQKAGLLFVLNQFVRSKPNRATKGLRIEPRVLDYSGRRGTERSLVYYRKRMPGAYILPQYAHNGRQLSLGWYQYNARSINTDLRVLDSAGLMAGMDAFVVSLEPDSLIEFAACFVQSVVWSQPGDSWVTARPLWPDSTDDDSTSADEIGNDEIELETELKSAKGAWFQSGKEDYSPPSSKRTFGIPLKLKDKDRELIASSVEAVVNSPLVSNFSTGSEALGKIANDFENVLKNGLNVTHKLDLSNLQLRNSSGLVDAMTGLNIISDTAELIVNKLNDDLPNQRLFFHLQRIFCNFGVLLGNHISVTDMLSKYIGAPDVVHQSAFGLDTLLTKIWYFVADHFFKIGHKCDKAAKAAADKLANAAKFAATGLKIDQAVRLVAHYFSTLFEWIKEKLGKQTNYRKCIESVKNPLAILSFFFSQEGQSADLIMKDQRIARVISECSKLVNNAWYKFSSNEYSEKMTNRFAKELSHHIKMWMDRFDSMIKLAVNQLTEEDPKQEATLVSLFSEPGLGKSTLSKEICEAAFKRATEIFEETNKFEGIPPLQQSQIVSGGNIHSEFTTWIKPHSRIAIVDDALPTSEVPESQERAENFVLQAVSANQHMLEKPVGDEKTRQQPCRLELLLFVSNEKIPTFVRQSRQPGLVRRFQTIVEMIPKSFPMIGKDGKQIEENGRLKWLVSASYNQKKKQYEYNRGFSLDDPRNKLYRVGYLTIGTDNQKTVQGEVEYEYDQFIDFLANKLVIARKNYLTNMARHKKRLNSERCVDFSVVQKAFPKLVRKNRTTDVWETEDYDDFANVLLQLSEGKKMSEVVGDFSSATLDVLLAMTTSFDDSRAKFSWKNGLGNMLETWDKVVKGESLVTQPESSDVIEAKRKLGIKLATDKTKEICSEIKQIDWKLKMKKLVKNLISWFLTAGMLVAPFIAIGAGIVATKNAFSYLKHEREEGKFDSIPFLGKLVGRQTYALTAAEVAEIVEEPDNQEKQSRTARLVPKRERVARMEREFRAPNEMLRWEKSGVEETPCLQSAFASRDAAVLAFSQKLISNTVRIHNSGEAGTGVMLDDRHLLTAAHVIRHSEAAAKEAGKPPFSGYILTDVRGKDHLVGIIHQYPMADVEHYDFDADITICVLDHALQGFKNICSKFLPDGEDVRMGLGSTGCTFALRRQKPGEPLTQIRAFGAVRPTRTYPRFTIDNSMQDGDSGAPIAVSLKDGPYVVGLHTAWLPNLGKSLWIAVTKEYVEEAVSFTKTWLEGDLGKRLASSSELSVVQAGPEDYLPLGSKYIRKTQRGERVMLPRKTHYKPTPFFEGTPSCGPIFTTAHKPARLTIFETENGVISPLELALRKLDIAFRAKPFPSVTRQKAIDIISKVMIENGIRNTVLTDDQTVNGIKLEDTNLEIDVEKMERSTSAGYPWSLWNKSSTTKRTWMKPADNSWKMEMSDEALERMSRVRRYIKEGGEKPEVIYTVCLKDEIVEEDRWLEGKTRLFAVAPLEVVYYGRKYFAAVGGFMKKNCLARYGIRYGINVHSSAAWNEVRSQHLEHNFHSDGDFSKFDGSMCFETLDDVRKILRNISASSDCTDEELDEMDRVYSLFINCRYICEDNIFEMGHGLPSGIPVTTIINSIANLYYHVCAWIDHGNSPGDFFSKNQCSFYGDDSIISTDNSAFTPNYLEEYFRNHNIKYTSANKTDEQAFKAFSEVQFLKRKFVVETRDGVRLCCCPLPVQVVEAIPCWSEVPGDVVAMRQVIDITLREACEISVELYNKYRAEFLKFDTLNGGVYGVCRIPHYDAMIKEDKVYWGEIQQGGIFSKRSLIEMSEIEKAKNDYQLALEESKKANEKVLRAKAAYGKLLETNRKYIVDAEKQADDDLSEIIITETRMQSGTEDRLNLGAEETHVEEQGLTGFIEEVTQVEEVAPVVETPVSSGFDKSLSSIEEFLARPKLLASVRLTEADDGNAVKYEFDPFHAFMMSVPVQQKCVGHRFVACEMVVEIRTNATSRTYGSYLVSYVNRYREPMLRLSRMTMHHLSQYPHVVVNTTGNSSNIIRIPFFYPLPGIDLTDNTLRTHLGRIVVAPLVPIGSLSGKAEATMNFFVFAEKVKLWGHSLKKWNLPTPLSYTGSKCPVYSGFYFSYLPGYGKEAELQSGKEKYSTATSGEAKKASKGFISTVAKTVADISQPIAQTSIPIVSSVAKATHIGAATAMSVAKMLGFSKPVTESNNTLVQGKQIDLVHAVGENTGRLLAFDNQAKVAPLMGLMQLNDDNLDLRKIAQIPAFLARVKLDYGKDPGTIYFMWAGHPLNNTVSTAGGAPEYVEIASAENYLSHCASTAMYWRGSMIMHYKVICSAFHSGYIRLTWLPGHGQTGFDVSMFSSQDWFTHTKSHVIDIGNQMETEGEFILPWEVNDWVLPVNPTYVKDAAGTQNRLASGLFIVSSVNPVACDEITATTPTLQLWISGGPDIDFFRPSQQNLTHGRPVFNMRVPTPMKEETIRLQSGEEVFDFSSIDPAVNMSDRCVDVKALMYRPVVYPYSGLPSPSASPLAVISPLKFSFLFGYSTTGTEINNLANAHRWQANFRDHILSMFSAQRGSFRVISRPATATSKYVNNMSTIYLASSTQPAQLAYFSMNNIPDFVSQVANGVVLTSPDRYVTEATVPYCSELAFQPVCVSLLSDYSQVDIDGYEPAMNVACVTAASGSIFVQPGDDYFVGGLVPPDLSYRLIVKTSSDVRYFMEIDDNSQDYPKSIMPSVEGITVPNYARAVIDGLRKDWAVTVGAENVIDVNIAQVGGNVTDSYVPTGISAVADNVLPSGGSLPVDVREAYGHSLNDPATSLPVNVAYVSGRYSSDTNPLYVELSAVGGASIRDNVPVIITAVNSAARIKTDLDQCGGNAVAAFKVNTGNVLPVYNVYEDRNGVSYPVVSTNTTKTTEGEPKEEARSFRVGRN